MKIKLKARARRDLKNIHAFISKDSLKGADKTIVRIAQSIAHLETFPLLGRKGRKEGTLELIIPNIPYIVIYSLPDEYHVMIETILHTSKKYP